METIQPDLKKPFQEQEYKEGKAGAGPTEGSYKLISWVINLI